MGEVYEGYDTALDRRVAIKFLRAHVPDANGIERFRTESRAIARLQHPHVVAVYRAGQICRSAFPLQVRTRAQSRKDTLAVALAAGTFLRIPASGSGRRSPLLRHPSSRYQARQCNADRWRRGETSRLRSSCQVRMTEEEARTSPLDGLNLEQESHSLTASGAMVGTPRYMAPELWQGMQATARSDVYSLGAMLYELACAEPPFTESPLR